MVNEVPEETRLTGREWLAAMAELQYRIRSDGNNLPHALKRDIAEGLIADDLIVTSKLQQLAQERAERTPDDHFARVKFTDAGVLPGCTEPACDALDIHYHGPACGPLCATCRGADQ